ncbi:shikimate kinase [Spirochaetia bacterium]|nr:shikimate kinase [Spirochaetia bacterium]
MGLIILTGPKHSGKTTVGRVLAEQCGGTFTDLDELVQTHTGKSPRTLFKEGPEVFRQAEAEALQSLLDTKVDGDTSDQIEGVNDKFRIVAAGGGLIDNGAALGLLKKNNTAILPPGTVTLVYLDVSAETAWERIKASTKKTGELPPFLNTDNPGETHRLLHEQRGAAYRKIAHIIVKAEGKSPEAIAKEIFAVIL